CPETHQKVKPADADTLTTLNNRIKTGALKNHQGDAVTRPIEAGLMREDGGCVYLIEDGIPNMLIEERVDL
ncbi:MAG: hypothetical protein OER88_05125, partial [Planctomycetota bacterium]|nr:hypothetical protein [Planctomycetota bacterium]